MPHDCKSTEQIAAESSQKCFELEQKIAQLEARYLQETADSIRSKLIKQFNSLQEEKKTILYIFENAVSNFIETQKD